jgi:hypothetical protein
MSQLLAPPPPAVAPDSSAESASDAEGLSDAEGVSDGEAAALAPPPQATEMGYQQTLMYGRYSKALGDLAREEGSRLRQAELERQRKKQVRC